MESRSNTETNASRPTPPRSFDQAAPNLLSLLAYLRPYRSWASLAFFCMLLQPMASSGRLYLIKVVIDDVLHPRDLGPLPWIVVAYLGLSLVKGIASFYDDYLCTWIGGRVIFELRSDLYAQLQRLNLTFYNNRRVGDLVARVVNDISSIETLLVSGISDLLTYLLSLGFVVGMLFYLDGRLTLMALFTAPVMFLSSLYYVRRIQAATMRVRTGLGDVAAVAEEGLSNVQTVKAFGREEFERERFEAESQTTFQASLEAIKLRASFGPVVDLLATLGTVVALWFGVDDYLRGRLSVGSLVAFLGYLGSIYTPLRGLARRSNLIQTAVASAERIFEIFHLEPSAAEASGGVVPDQVAGKIHFNHVTFSYDGRSEILKNFSLEIPEGETVVLVGESGAGKTTLASLLLRFYEPQKGRILLDGIDLRDIDIRTLRNLIGVVPQEPFLFTGTVRENIRYGRLDATDEEVERAARLAFADEFIRQFPMGYETTVGRKGATLSGGERQRIAIARAFLKNAPILILDEATAALDAYSEGAVQAALRSLVEGRTTLIISHSFSTVQFAELVVVLERGALAGVGTHEELLRTCASYKKLLAQPAWSGH